MLKITIKRIRQLTFSSLWINTPLLISFNASQDAGAARHRGVITGGRRGGRSERRRAKEHLWKASRRRTTIIKRRKVDNNSKSDRRTSELWHLSRTTASSAAIMKSPSSEKKKEDKEMEVKERTIAAWDIFSRWQIPGHGIPRRICKFAQMRHAEKCAANNVQLFPFCPAVLRFRISSFAVTRQIDATRSWFNLLLQENGSQQMSLLYFFICLVGFRRLEKKKVCHPDSILRIIVIWICFKKLVNT